jgi:starch phosphorylase
LDRDDYMLMADFPSYIEAQNRVSALYQEKERWTRMSIANTAKSGKFSSDRSIKEYCEEIWRVGPVSVEVK